MVDLDREAVQAGLGSHSDRHDSRVPSLHAPEQATGQGVDHRADIYDWRAVPRLHGNYPSMVRTRRPSSRLM